MKDRGQVRRGQVVTTYGPGALIDLPRDSGIVGGLDTWPKTSELEEILDPRLALKIQKMTGVLSPRFYSPPPDSNDPSVRSQGIGVWRFPEWYVVQDEADGGRKRSRRLVHRRMLEPNRKRFDGRLVVATRFVRACPRGHVDDIDWMRYVHGDEKCVRQLWLDEQGTSGDLSDLVVRCECGRSRSLIDAMMIEDQALGFCNGRRPWLNDYEGRCKQPARLLIRTASNAYFPQVVSVLSLPDRGSAVETVVRELWDDLSIVESLDELAFLKKKPLIAEKLTPFDADEVLKTIDRIRTGGEDAERPVKQVEIGALIAAPEGFGDDVPVNPNFHARRLPDHTWRRSRRFDGVESVIQLHRLREVRTLTGFTRFEAVTPDIHGEYDTDVEAAQIAIEPHWFPAVENRGEGVFLQLGSAAVQDWLERPGVKKRVDELRAGHDLWAELRRKAMPFPGGPYVLLHTLSHLLLQSLAMRCGYPAASIRERIYADAERGRYGVLLYTGSPDAEGTLGGLVQEARHIEDHLRYAMRLGSLCSNDPICAQHQADKAMEGRQLLGAACHGCALVAESSCEMRNDYLDRGLVVPVLGHKDAAFFQVTT